MLEDEQASRVGDQLAKQAGKGRPTPKRSEVERRRREPAPTDRKTAAARDRETRKAEWRRQQEAQRRGDPAALKPKDRGPVRALARDYVDSRRLIFSEFVLFVFFVLILGAFFLGAARSSNLILLIELAILVVIGGEAFYHSLRVTRLAKQRCPDESRRGLLTYIAMRSIRLRSSRMPKPRVKRGQAI
jgi:hypothetical protein